MPQQGGDVTLIGVMATRARRVRKRSAACRPCFPTHCWRSQPRYGRRHESDPDSFGKRVRCSVRERWIREQPVQRSDNNEAIRVPDPQPRFLVALFQCVCRVGLRVALAGLSAFLSYLSRANSEIAFAWRSTTNEQSSAHGIQTGALVGVGIVVGTAREHRRGRFIGEPIGALPVTANDPVSFSWSLCAKRHGELRPATFPARRATRSIRSRQLRL